MRLYLMLLTMLLWKNQSRAFLIRHSTSRRNRRTSQRYLNRFLFDAEQMEHNYDDATIKKEPPSSLSAPIITIPRDDYRTVHAAKILGLENGATVRAGIVGENGKGLWTDQATVEWIPEGSVKKKEVLGNGNPPGSLKVTLDGLQPPPDALIPSVSLILALPRPLALGRLLPMITQLGVEHLVLSSAAKVPKDYFGSHLFRKPQELRERLIEGLCQAGDVRLPKLTIVKNLRHFLSDDLDTLFPQDTYARVIAHPQRISDTGHPPKRMRHVQFPTSSSRKIVLAVGPEGGWEEPEELERFRQRNFQQITLGPRVLRSDCAVVSLLSLANDHCQADEEC